MNDKTHLEEAELTQGDATPKNQEAPETGNRPKDKLISSLLEEEEGSAEVRRYHWRDLLLNDGEWIRRQIPLFILIVLGIIFYITNRYQAQKDIIELSQLQTELKDMKFRVLTRSSELTMKTRQSKLEAQLKALGDSTLKATEDAPFIIEKNK